MPYIVPNTPHPDDELVKALLMAAITKGASLAFGDLGQVPTSPMAQNPGTFNFPPGSQSPLEAAQIQQMGGVPTTAGFNARATQLPSASGISYQPPTRLGHQPDLSRQLDQLKIQQAQQNLNPNSPMNQFLTSQAQRMLNPTSASSGIDSNGELARYLAKKALEGDAEADAMLQGMGY